MRSPTRTTLTASLRSPSSSVSPCPTSSSSRCCRCAAHRSRRGSLRTRRRLVGSTTFDHTSTALGDTRTVTVWSPPTGGTDLPLVVLLDGESYLHIAHLPRALDLAVQRGDMPPAVVAFVPGAQGSRGLADRTRELSCNAAHASMLADELVPALRATHPVSSSPDGHGPGRRQPGRLAEHVHGARALRRRRQRAQRVGQLLVRARSARAPEWLHRSASPRSRSRPIRLYQQIGRLEDGPLPFAPGCHPPRRANRRFRDAALARGYDLHYDELGTAHDICAFRVATVRGLQHLLRR